MARSTQGTSPRTKPAAKLPPDPVAEDAPPPPAPPEPDENGLVDAGLQFEYWLTQLDPLGDVDENGIIEHPEHGPQPHPTLILAQIVAMLGDQGTAVVTGAREAVLNRCLLRERKARK